MKPLAIQIKDLSKQYRLGLVTTGTLLDDINRWWHTARGKPDPYLKVAEVNARDSAGTSDYVWAIRNINLDVEPGEVIGIIGKNGAGKSTLLKILSRVTGPTQGFVKVKGRIASLLEVGTGFHPELTGKDNIFLNGAILGMSRAEIRSKLDDIVSFSGTARYLNTPVKRYSSGMRVRLGFAVAAHLEPEILVIDEVLAVGDADFQEKAVGKMKDVSQRDGRTILFVSHNMRSIQNLCTRVVVLKDGMVDKIGDPADMVKYYLQESRSAWSKDSKGFIGSVTRRGEGGAYFEDVQINNENGSGSNFDVKVGEDLTLKIRIRVETPLQSLSTMVAIRESISNDTIASTPKFELDSRYYRTPGEFGFEIRIKDLNLVPGSYGLYLWLGGSNKNKYDILDNDLPPLTVYADRNSDEYFKAIHTSGYFRLKSELNLNET